MCRTPKPPRLLYFITKWGNETVSCGYIFVDLGLEKIAGTDLQLSSPGDQGSYVA